MLEPLSFSQAKTASKISCFMIPQMYKNYSFVPLYKENGEFLTYNNEIVYQLLKNGVPLKTPLLLKSAIWGSETFYSAADILQEYEGLSYDDSLKEVYYSFHQSSSSANELSEEIFKFLSPDDISRFRPFNCSQREWNMAGIKRKIYLIRRYSTENEIRFLINRYNVTTTKISDKIYPMKFCPPVSRKNCSHIVDYLVNNCGFEQEFVEWLIQKHLIYEDTQFNLVCPGYDEKNVIKFAYVHSSWDRKDGGSAVPLSEVLHDSIPEYSWKFVNPLSRTLYVFEDMIDLLTYMNIMRLYNHHYPNDAAPIMELSSFLYIGFHIEGQDIPPALSSFLALNTNIKKVMICFANDDYGLSTANDLRTRLKSNKYISEVVSLGNDYSSYKDYLIRLKERIRVGAPFSLE